jgi:predicted DNA-binding protein
MSDFYKDSFYLTKQEKEKMVKKAKEYGVTTSEMLRRIIDKYFEEPEAKNEQKRI